MKTQGINHNSNSYTQAFSNQERTKRCINDDHHRHVKSKASPSPPPSPSPSLPLSLSLSLQAYGIDIKDPSQPLLVSKPKKRDIRARGGDDSPILLVPELCTRTGQAECRMSELAISVHKHGFIHGWRGCLASSPGSPLRACVIIASDDL